MVPSSLPQYAEVGGFSRPLPPSYRLIPVFMPVLRCTIAILTDSNIDLPPNGDYCHNNWKISTGQQIGEQRIRLVKCARNAIHSSAFSYKTHASPNTGGLLERSDPEISPPEGTSVRKWGSKSPGGAGSGSGSGVGSHQCRDNLYRANATAAAARRARAACGSSASWQCSGTL